MEAKQIPFSIDAWQRLVVEEKTHEVRTRNGLPARVVAVDRAYDPYPVVALVKMIPASEKITTHLTNGAYNQSGAKPSYDLVLMLKPPVSLGWVAVCVRKSLMGVSSKCVSALHPTKSELLSWFSLNTHYDILSDPIEVFAKP